MQTGLLTMVAASLDVITFLTVRVSPFRTLTTAREADALAHRALACEFIPETVSLFARSIAPP